MDGQISKKAALKIAPSKAIIYILLSLWALTTIFPFVWVINNSFKPRSQIVSDSFSLSTGENFTLENYKLAFNRVNIGSAYLHSLTVSVSVMAFVILFAGFAAYGLARYNFKGKGFLESLIIASMMFPVFSTIIPVFTMEKNWGIASTNTVFLSLLSVTLPQIAGNLSFAIVVLRGYIRGLPTDLEESAFLEGCGAVKAFFKIIVPITKPSFATVAIFSFLWSYNDLFTQIFFLRRKDEFTITRLLNELTSMEGTNYGLMAAAVTLVVIPVLIAYIFLQKNIIKGMTAGALKG
ncbi:MAG: carbohydrate ABC transporter permease [Clostridiales bacterium]|nr:carbohydrate ABC transporter permease [Clostridiales bacterium]